MRMLHMVSEAQVKLKDAHQPRIQFEIALLKLIHMERSENLNKLLEEIDALKKNSSFLEKPESSTHSRVISAPIPKDAITQNSPEHTSTLQYIALESTQSKDIESVTETTPKSDPISDEFDLGSPALVTEVTHQANEIHGNNGYHYSLIPLLKKGRKRCSSFRKKTSIRRCTRSLAGVFKFTFSKST